MIFLRLQLLTRRAQWAALFRACTRAGRGPRAPPPQTPFAVAAVLALAATAVAAGLPCGGAQSVPRAQPPAEDGSAQQGETLREPLLDDARDEEA